MLFFLSTRYKPSTPNSFAIWFVRSSDMLPMRRDAWNCWRSPRISVLWSSARLVWALTSVARGSVKNCPTFWHKCARLDTPNKRTCILNYLHFINYKVKDAVLNICVSFLNWLFFILICDAFDCNCSGEMCFYILEK